MKNSYRNTVAGSLALFTCVSLAAFASRAAADTTLEQYRDIVIPPKVSPVVKSAAQDLQYHLVRITGREFPIVERTKAAPDGLHFFVGKGVVPEHDEAIAKLPMEGWMIRSVPKGLLLAGNEKAVTPSFTFYHPVSIFLENHCGVRWLWPGKSGEVIPRNPKMVIPTLNESGTPLLKRRKLDFYYARFWQPQIKKDLAVWHARTRQGNQLNAAFGHAWGAILPAQQYFKEHPEWFALSKGKRQPYQLCVSNMQMRDEFAKRLISLPANQRLDIASVSAQDGGGFCECELCQAKGTKERVSNDQGYDYQLEAYWEFVNDIAQRVKQQRPGLGVGSFAYTMYREPPGKIERMSDNVYLSMTTYSTQLMTPEGMSDYKRLTDAWKSKGVPIMMREYWGMYYWMDLPILYPEEIAATIKFGVDAGMMGAYGECGKNWSTQAPNYYVLTHMLWDPKADPKKLLDEFYGAFGKSEEPVRAYFGLLEDAVEQAWKDYKIQPSLTQLVSHYGDIFTPKLMAKAAAHLEEAAKAAANDEELKARIDFLRIGCEYTTVVGELFGHYTRMGRGGLRITTFSRLEKVPVPQDQIDASLKRAWVLGQRRLQILNDNKDNFALDEGLIAHTLESPRRHWHQFVAQKLGIPPTEIVPLEYVVPKKKEVAATDD